MKFLSSPARKTGAFTYLLKKPTVDHHQLTIAIIIFPLSNIVTPDLNYAATVTFQEIHNDSQNIAGRHWTEMEHILFENNVDSATRRVNYPGRINRVKLWWLSDGGT